MVRFGSAQIHSIALYFSLMFYHKVMHDLQQLFLSIELYLMLFKYKVIL